MEVERVALVMDWHPESIGGVQAHVRDLAYRLKKRGLEVVIVSRRVGAGEIKAYEDEGHYLVKPLIPLDSIVVPPDPSSLEEALRRFSPDVVHSHHIFALTSLMALKAASKLGIARLITNHTIQIGYEREELWRLLSLLLPTRYYLRYAQLVVSVSRAADKLVKAIIDDAVPRRVIPNAVDTERFRPPEREPDEPVVLFVGRLVHRKGPHVLVRAFKLVVEEVPEAKLVIVGKGHMEPLLRALISKLDLSGNVKLVGAVNEEEKPLYYRSSWVVAVPSLYNESFGIVALEGMASGRPVVATRHGGLAEVVEHGRTGLLVKPGDHRELAEAIVELLQDEKRRVSMGREARRVAVEKYSWDRVLDSILGAYRELTSGGG